MSKHKKSVNAKYYGHHKEDWTSRMCEKRAALNEAALVD